MEVTAISPVRSDFSFSSCFSLVLISRSILARAASSVWRSSTSSVLASRMTTSSFLTEEYSGAIHPMVWRPKRLSGGTTMGVDLAACSSPKAGMTTWKAPRWTLRLAMTSPDVPRQPVVRAAAMINAAARTLVFIVLPPGPGPNHDFISLTESGQDLDDARGPRADGHRHQVLGQPRFFSEPRCPPRDRRERPPQPAGHSPWRKS